MKNLLVSIYSIAFSAVCLPLLAGEPTPAELFERNLRPILDSPASSSCTQCHLAGVELKNYIAPTHEATFRSLRDQGLIDLDQPDKSRILALINMQEEGSKSGRGGETQSADKRRRAEYAAFREWIAASAKDKSLRALPPLENDKLTKPVLPNEVIRHARKDRVLESFENNVWAFRFRCMSCHIEGSPENDKLRKEHGNRVAWIKRGGPAGTMAYLLGADVIDADEPDQSLLLLKPLGKVKHGGGTKFAPGDLGYQAFRRWIEDYARTVKGEYKTAQDLPKHDNVARFGTDIWIKLADTPPTWADKLLRVDLYAWDADAEKWESAPIASTDRVVWGQGKLWQHNLTLSAKRGGTRAQRWRQESPALPPGKYLAKVYVSHSQPNLEHWQQESDDQHFVGQAEVESNWPAAYGKMTSIDAARVRK